MFSIAGLRVPLFFVRLVLCLRTLAVKYTAHIPLPCAQYDMCAFICTIDWVLWSYSSTHVSMGVRWPNWWRWWESPCNRVTETDVLRLKVSRWLERLKTRKLRGSFIHTFHYISRSGLWRKKGARGFHWESQPTAWLQGWKPWKRNRRLNSRPCFCGRGRECCLVNQGNLF